MKLNRVGRVMIVGVLVLAGCAAKGERVDISIPGGATSQAASVASGGGLRVVVNPFEDARSDRMHLGSRSHFWGGTSNFDVPKSTVGEAVAKALVLQLNRRGWQASLAGHNGAAQPDATISGSVRDLSVTAVSKFFHTEIAVKNTLMLRVANHGDESSIQERVLGSGSDEVFWFDPEDAEKLVNEVLEKNIEKFIADTKIVGKAVRLR